MNDSISILEQLVTAIEQAGVNVAPTYQEYMPLAFAIANSCGEEGRTRFHRICRISEKYHHDEADKLYGHALTKGTGRNSLGTVFHLAEVAGVKMDPKLANLQNLQSLHTHTRARVSYNAHPDTSDGTPPDTVFTDPASPLSDGVSKTILPARLPSFPDYRWPAFLQGIIDCGNSPAQRDILLLGAATVLGSTLNKLVSFVYGRKHKYPCLQVFVTAPPASGKGALTWVRRLAEPIHNALLDTYREKIKTYRMEKTKWDTLGKEKANTPEPEQPQLKMLLIAGDNTGTGIQENLMDSGGVGLICETEADTVSTAIGGDHGHWSDLLRKCFDHDRLAYNRRTNHEYRECNVTFLCVLLSGTPAQIKPLIPSAENGLFSRQLFYYMPAIEEWEDQFNEADTDYDSRFLEWGAQWKEVLDAITASVSNINMKLTHEQKEIFNFHFARVFGRASAIHGNQMKSAVTRIAINIFRIISIIALLRSLESLLPGGERSGEPQENIVRTLLNCPGLTPSAHIPQENIADGIVPQFNLSIRTDDFYAVLALVEPLYRHACHILSLLPAGTPTAPSANMTPETLFDCLPLRFTRNEAIDKGEQVGVPGRLGGLAAETYDRTRTAGQSGAWRIRIQRAHAHTYVCGCERECKFCKFARFLNLKCINMKDFLYFPSMTKGSLALLYFPGSNPRIATRHLMRWINGCPPLMEELSATGYHTSQKVFTSRQVTLINRHLGSPG